MPGETDGARGKTGLTGERGPTGDHGQAGDEGETGLEGRRGPMGLTGTPARPRRPLVTILLIVTVLCGLTVVGAALYVAIDAGRSETRVVDENRALRREVAMLREENEAERQADDCALLYERDTQDGRAQIVSNVWHLFVALAEDVPREQLVQAVREGDREAGELEASLAAQQEYQALDPPPEACPHPRWLDHP